MNNNKAAKEVLFSSLLQHALFNSFLHQLTETQKRSRKTFLSHIHDNSESIYLMSLTSHHEQSSQAYHQNRYRKSRMLSGQENEKS
jgi:hypothetical protein